MDRPHPNGHLARDFATAGPPASGLLPEDEARRLRRGLIHSLRGAGFTAAQIEQILGWKGRTIRRDLADPEGGRTPLIGVVDDDAPDVDADGRGWPPRSITREDLADLLGGARRRPGD